jgi:hypothetical protein
MYVVVSLENKKKKKNSFYQLMKSRGATVTKDTRGVSWTFWWTYARSGKCTLLSVVRTYVGGPPDVRSVNHTGGRTWDHRTYATF